MAAPAGRGPEAGDASDVAGALILAACAIWTLISAAGRETRPEGVLLALLAVAAGFACGRVCGTLLPVAAAAVAALASLVMAVMWRHGVPGATAAGDTAPGHTGAAAALLVLTAGAACCAAAATRRESLRFTLRLLALGTACASLGLGSVAGFAAAAGVLLCSLAAARMRSRLLGLAGFGDQAPAGVPVDGRCRRSRMNRTPASASSTVTVNVLPSPSLSTRPSPRRTTTAVPCSGRQR